MQNQEPNNSSNGDAARPFSCSQGKTFLQKKSNKICIFDFTLKMFAEVVNCKNSAEDFKNHCVFELKCKNNNNETYTSQLITLAGKSFESRNNFGKALSEQGHHFVHIPHVVNAEILSAYLHFLREEYLQNPASMTVADIIGSYDCGTWVLSNEIQIKGQLLVPDVERQYVVLRNLQNFSLSLETSVLGADHLINVISKIIDYSAAFGCNKLSFLQVISFAILRLLKSRQKEAPADEAKYCLIYSLNKSVGKTKTLMMIAQGQGIKNPVNHNLSIAGGDGFLNGMSCKLQQKTFASTNLLVIVNEIKMSPTIANSLNQCHDSLSSGSLGTGIVKPRASIIGSCNTKEHERLEGRMVRINYINGKYSDEMDRLLKNRLEPLCDSNVGFLMAWCIKHEDYWEFTESLIKYPLHAVVKEKMPQRQSRYTWSITGNIIVFYMLFITTNKRCDPLQIFEHVVGGDEQEEQNFLERFCNNLIESVKSSSGIFTCFNPSTSFTDMKKRNQPSFAIRTTFFGSFTDVSPKELGDFMSKFGKNAWQVNCRFCTDPLSTLDDVNVAGKVKDERAYKLPWSAIPHARAVELKKELGMTHHEDASVVDECDDRVKSLYERMKSIFTDFYAEDHAVGNESATESDDEVLQFLNPVDAALFKNFSPNCKRAFHMGRQCETDAGPSSRRRLNVEEN